jgi:tripartite-type tricarboxylate transporter receptor subunit TctC
MKLLIKAAVCALLAATSMAGNAQDSYPQKSITMVVPAAPGGAGDVVARAISPGLTAELGKTVVVDNRGGASGTIGAGIVARAAPDGYTLLLAPAPSIVVEPNYRKLDYDPLKDLAPITLVATSPNILVVHPSLPVKSLKQLIALAKAKPDALNFGSSGQGAPSGIAGEVFNKLAGTRIAHVPFKGAGPATVALLSGEVQVMFAPITVAFPYVRDNRMRALAVTSKARAKIAPQLPTLIESGVSEEIVSFYGLFAPARVPAHVIGIVHRAVADVLKTPKVADYFERSGTEVVGSTPAEFAAYVREQYAIYGKIVRDIGLKSK